VKLTQAQRSWLLAAKGDGLNVDAVWPGSSYRCVERLVSIGLLEKRHVPTEGPRYFITAAGRKSLTAAQRGKP